MISKLTVGRCIVSPPASLGLMSACVELGAALRVCMQIQILYLNPHSWEHFGCVRTNLEVFINKVEIFSYFGLPKSVKHILEDT